MPVSIQTVTPVILSGGSGTRLWPLSRPEKPKQFLPLTADETMLQLTLARTAVLDNCGTPIIVASGAHAELVEHQVGGDALIILEPFARNTAPAIALAALAANDSGTALLVMPSDHVILNVAAFHDAINRALPIVADGWLVTMGITPDRPETGYGYIKLAEPLADGIRQVENFIEKPKLAKAEAMLAAGGHVWNAGIFLFRADAYLAALERFEPEMLACAKASFAAAERSGRSLSPGREALASCPSNSIDYAVMERSDKIACVSVDMGWSDVGSWDVLHDIAVKDVAGNASDAAATLIESNGCLVRSDGPHITIVGVDDLIVVATGNEVMIVPRGKSQLVKHAAESAAARKNGGRA